MTQIYLTLSILTCAILMFLLKLGFIFVILALLPSCVAFFVDMAKGRPKFKTVFACNLAALLPSLAPMLQAAINFQDYDTNTLISNPEVWMFIYGGAASGWAIIHISAMLSHHLAHARNSYAIERIEERQKVLLQEWGDDIQDPKPSSTQKNAKA